MALRSNEKNTNSHIYSSDSNELSDVDIGDDEDLDLDADDGLIDEDGHTDQNDQEVDDLDEHENDDEPDDPEDAEDYSENDDNDENDPETHYDLQDAASEESEEDIIAPVAPKRSTRPTREIKKRQLTFYEEDDLLDSEEEAPTAKKKQTKAKPPPKRTPARNALRAAKKDPDDFSEFELEYRPNPQKLTERQRAKLEDDPNGPYEDLMFARMDQQLLALNRKTAKRIETEEQIALRRAENARKRAHYKVKQLEEAKRDTLNKLLKRRATKTREKETEEDVEEKLTLKPRRPVITHPAMLRWVSRPEGSLLAATEPVFFSKP